MSNSQTQKNYRDQSNVRETIKYVIKYLKKKNYFPDAVVLLQPTSPLREAIDIKESCKL